MARSCGRLRKASGLRRRPSAAAWRVAPSGVSRSSSPSGRLQDSIKDLKSGLSRNSEKTSWLWWRPHPLWCLWEEGCLQGGLHRWSLPDWNPHPPQQWAHPGIEESPQNRILKDPRGGYSRQQVRTPPEAFHHSLSGKPGESTKADLPLIQRHVEALTMAGEDFLGIWDSKLNTVLCLQSQTDLVAVFMSIREDRWRHWEEHLLGDVWWPGAGNAAGGEMFQAYLNLFCQKVQQGHERSRNKELTRGLLEDSAEDLWWQWLSSD